MNKSDKDEEIPDPSGELKDALRAMPSAERRLVMLAYSKVRAGDAELKPYQFGSAELAESLMIREEELGKLLEDLCRKLFKRPVVLRRVDGGWLISSWLSAIERGPSAESYAFRVHPTLKRLFLDLRRQSLIAPLDAYMRLEGKYSLRILEMLLEGRPKGKASGYWEIEVPIDAIRASFKLNDRYKKAKALKKWVVMGAVTAINLADLGMRVEVETTLQAKKTKGFIFKVRQRGTKPERYDGAG
jgi:plasmid replication initiation protein